MSPIFKKAADISHAAVVITDADAIIRYVNDAFCELTGYSKEESIGQNPRILQSGIQAADYKELWGALSQGKEWTGEFCNKAKDGTLFWELATIAPAQDSTGALCYVGVKSNITKVRQLEEKLVSLCEKAEKSYESINGALNGG